MGTPYCRTHGPLFRDVPPETSVKLTMLAVAPTVRVFPNIVLNFMTADLMQNKNQGIERQMQTPN
jgi:hypothetical protein